MAGITWLHLSDWHQKGADFDREVVRDKLLEDLRDRAKIDPSLARIDFVVFSGDLAWSGQAKEYEAAQKHLLDPVLAAVGLGPDRVFIVPGNHDLDRDAIAELPAVLQDPLRDEKAVLGRLTDEKKRARSLDHMTAFASFVESYNRQPTPLYASMRAWEINGRRVALLGLNSAWMCGRNKTKKDEVDDYGQIILGEPQLHDALERWKDADLRIGVMHHPFEWLTGFDRDRVEGRLLHAAHFVLRGHTHDPKVLPQNGTDGACVVIPAGAAYDRRSSSQRYANAYNFVRLDLDTGKGKVFLRRWSEPRTAWREDVDTTAQGVFPFRLPASLRATSKRTRATPKRSKDGPDDEARRAAELRYRKLLLATCDIVDLAGLPEDRTIVQRRLELRRLYVPLRARVEAPAGEELTETGWDEVERRRHKTWLGERAEDGAPGEEETRQPVGTRLAAARRLVVLGDPGAGKTTLTRWLATAYLLRLEKDPDWKDLHDVETLPDADWLPIVVRCRDLNAACVAGALDDVLQHTFRKAELSKDEGDALVSVFRERLGAGTALLILDGLDEIADPKVRARFCRQIEQIVVAYPQAPVIATSRIVGYREMGYRIGRDFEHLLIADLARDEKDQFTARWCALTEPPERRDRATQDLLHDIHSNERIERLTGNPMLLTTMALVRRRVGRLPQRRVELYFEALQVLLHWRAEVDEAIEWQEAIPQLEYLAYAMCDRGVQRLPRHGVLALFAKMRADYPSVHAVHKRTPEEFLRVVEARTGILVEAGHVRHLGTLVPVYEMRHLTFQEYLAARALVDGKFPGHEAGRSLAASVAPLAGRVGETRSDDAGVPEITVVESWREPLRLCVAMCQDSDVDEVLRAVVSSAAEESADVKRARAIQAVLCLADDPNASDQIAEEIWHSFAANVREGDATGTIGTATGTAAGDAVMELAHTRWAAGLRRNLVQRFRETPVAARKSYSGLLVRMIDSTLSSPGAVDQWWRSQLAGLPKANDDAAIEFSLGMAIVTFRKKLREPMAVEPHLVGWLGAGGPLSHAAAWALYWMRINAGWRPSEGDITCLLQLLARPDADPEAVRWVARILGRERREEAVEPLLRWLQDPSVWLRERVLKVLGQIGTETALAEARRYLKHPEQRLRSAAVDALADRLDKTDRRLLTSDLDGIEPYIDPPEPITEERVKQAAATLHWSHDAVRARYRALAADLGLHLAFDDPPTTPKKPATKRRARARKRTPA